MDPNVVAGDSSNLDRPAANQPAGANTPAAMPAAQRLDDGWHPWHSVIGIMGYGSRGTLLRKHAFTLGFKLVLGLAQVGFRAFSSTYLLITFLYFRLLQ
jgi:hypothetical protein